MGLSRFRICHAVLLAVLVSSFHLVADDCAELVQLRLTYARLLDATNQQFAPGGKEYTVDYPAEWARLEALYQERGELRSLLAVRNERQRFVLAGAVTPADLVETPLELREVQQRLLAMDRRRLEAVAGLEQTYLAQLGKLQRSLTTENRIADAVQVMKEAESFAAGPEEAAVADGAGADPKPKFVKRVVWETCARCGGTGGSTTPCGNRMCEDGTITYTGTGSRDAIVTKPCPVCRGRGGQINPCGKCRGEGRISRVEMVEVVATDPDGNGGFPSLDPEPEREGEPEPGPEAETDANYAMPALGADFFETEFPVLPATEGPRSAPVAMQRRPRPADLDFGLIVDELKAYLKQQPAGILRLEKERIMRVNQVRSHLIKCMKYLPYGDEGTTIQLRDGKQLRGTVPFCNDYGFSVKLNRRSTKLEQVEWDDLAFSQYPDFFDFYIKCRLELGAKGDAAADYFLLALLCDWYGEQDRARRYRDRAVSLDPRLAPQLDRFLYYLEAED